MTLHDLTAAQALPPRIACNRDFAVRDDIDTDDL